VTGQGIQEKVIEAVVIMNTAIINLRLYPPTNAMIIKTIDRLYDTFQNIFEQESSVSLAESEKNLLISGESLTQKNQEKPQVAIFLMLMINWGIKSLTFHKNLNRDELSFFLELMGKKPDDVKKEKGLDQITEEGKMPNIQINQKIYISTDEDHQIITGMDIKDEDIIEYITSDNPSAALDPDKLQEIAKDPEWISRIFQSGMQHLVEKDGSTSNIALSESMIHMLRSLDGITQKADKERVSLLAAKSIADMDADLIATVITRNMEGLLENNLFDQIIDRIDHEKFEVVAGKLHQMSDTITPAGKDSDSAEINAAQHAYQQLMSTDKGVELQQQIEEKQAREKEEREKRIRETREKVNAFLSSLDEGKAQEDAVTSLPEMVEALFSEGEIEFAEATIDRLVNSLQSEQKIRTVASHCLADILEKLTPKRQTDILSHRLENLLVWIKMETSSSNDLKRVCIYLKDLAQVRIRNRRFAESLPILESFRFAASPQTEKDSQIQVIMADQLREVSSSDNLDILFEEFLTDKSGQRNEAGRNLVMMVEYSINRLLDILMESEVSSERVMILNLIPEMGKVAAPAVTARIEGTAPWYYLRNLARLLGRIGSAEDAKSVLPPLLVYDDIRVQKETFKSINNIGGTYRGEIFLNALSGCDDQLKVSIVNALGSLKHRDAVKPLVELFKSKLNLTDDMKVELQEKICLALGNIGDKEALPFLTEIGKQSGIFSFKAYNPKIKVAAARAAAMLSRN